MILTAVAVAAAATLLTGCSSTSTGNTAAITALASLGTTGALIAYPQYRGEMQLADNALTAVCDSTNGITADTIEGILAQDGVTNQYAELGISGVIAVADLFAANQVTNGIPVNQTIQTEACAISAGMTQALNGAVLAKAPVHHRHWYYLWLK